VAGLEAPLLARDLYTVGRTVEKAAVRWSRARGEYGTRVTDGKGSELHPSPIPSESHDEGGVFLGLLVELNVATEVPAKADLDDDESVMLFVKRGRFGGGSVCDTSSIDEVRCSAMFGVEQHPYLSTWEDPIRNAVCCRGALYVPGGGGKTPVVVPESLGS